MENTIPEKTKNVAETIVAVPIAVAAVVVAGTETVLVEGAKDLVQAGTVVVHAVETAGVEIAHETEKVGEDVARGFSPPPSSLIPPKTPVEVAPVV